MTAFKESMPWNLGSWGEAVVRRWLQEMGWYVIPLGLIEQGGAPKLMGWTQQHVLPDVQRVREGEVGLVEVKTKSGPVWHQKTQQHRHGVEARLWGEYRAVQREMALPFELAIVQKVPPMLLTQSFERLGDGLRGDAGHEAYFGNKAMVFWPIDWFERYEVDGDELCRLGGGTAPDLPAAAQRPWGTKAVGPRQLPLLTPDDWDALEPYSNADLHSAEAR